MKKITLIVAALFTTVFGFAQTNGKISLVKGKKMIMENEVVTSSLMSMMGQSMETKMNFNSTSNIIVDDVIDNTYKLTNTLTKAKMVMDVMGERMEYDSEKPNSTNELSKSMDALLNEPKSVIIDNQGKLISNKDDKPSENESPMNNDASDITNAFIVLPENIKVGDKFDINKNDSKTNTSSSIKYTVRSIEGDIARLTFTGKVKSDGVSERQGMEVRTNTNGNINGECSVNIKTGIITTLESKTKMRGNVSVMEQEMPIENEITSKLIIKEVE